MEMKLGRFRREWDLDTRMAFLSKTIKRSTDFDSEETHNILCIWYPQACSNPYLVQQLSVSTRRQKPSHSSSFYNYLDILKMASSSRLLTVAAFILNLVILTSGANTSIRKSSVKFYQSECPTARIIVGAAVLHAIKRDHGLPAALLRMQFHDCFVRGCDASILIDSNQTNLAEKDGVGNAFSVRGYELIDQIKAMLEEVCPGVVSCADIIALASRDSIAAIGGPSWSVVSGRRDGLFSSARETPSNLPPPFADYPFLVNRFTRKGLTEREMVVLSGAHTIGIAHCGVIQARLYNSTGPDGVDPTLEPTLAAELKKQCPFGAVMNEIFMDPTKGGNSFDSTYFSRVQNNQGVFISDAALITTDSGRAIVAEEASPSNAPFFGDFAAAMEKMSNIEILSKPAGEIRRNCRFLN
ncbi:hypothetical protein Mapa_002149 [Marchantia paleacea]|nr:hypothetical protein Mapa_002149 [Marchantia paleacea]